MKTLIGSHNYQNAAAAVAIALSLRVEQPEIELALQCFKGLPHRQELVRELFGVNFINDSKATNFDATERALSSFKSIYWIAGDLSKDNRITKSFFKNLKNLVMVKILFHCSTLAHSVFSDFRVIENLYWPLKIISLSGF